MKMYFSAKYLGEQGGINRKTGMPYKLLVFGEGVEQVRFKKDGKIVSECCTLVEGMTYNIVADYNSRWGNLQLISYNE